MKKLISIAVSLTILVIIYWKIDFPKLIEVFQNSDKLWMAISLGMVVPLTMLTAWRLQQLTPSRTRLGFGEANRLILTASVLNMVLPSKMGDIVKAYFIKERGHLEGSLSLSLVVFEKACDMLSLLLWCAFGLTLYPQKDWLFWIMTASVISGLIIGSLLIASRQFANLIFQLTGRIAPGKISSKIAKLRDSWSEMHKYFWRDKRHILKITLTSVVIWFGHLLQIWFFTLALKEMVPFLAHLA